MTSPPARLRLPEDPWQPLVMTHQPAATGPVLVGIDAGPTGGRTVAADARRVATTLQAAGRASVRHGGTGTVLTGDGPTRVTVSPASPAFMAAWADGNTRPPPAGLHVAAAGQVTWDVAGPDPHRWPDTPIGTGTVGVPLPDRHGRPDGRVELVDVDRAGVVTSVPVAATSVRHGDVVVDLAGDLTVLTPDTDAVTVWFTVAVGPGHPEVSPQDRDGLDELAAAGHAAGVAHTLVDGRYGGARLAVAGPVAGLRPVVDRYRTLADRGVRIRHHPLPPRDS